MQKDKIIILDFGSQYSQLILRKLREINIESDLLSCFTSLDQIFDENPKGIILSGGPASVYETDSPKYDPKILDLNIPILGICYGMQLLTYLSGGIVEKSTKREYGKTDLNIEKVDVLFDFVPWESIVWMSHSDKVIDIPDNFESLASSINTKFAAIKHKDKNLYGVQFHPEVHHSQFGLQILENFATKICKCEKNWNIDILIEKNIENIRNLVGAKKVLCALSGGVDSTVAAMIAHRAIGDNLICIHIDNGLMRKNESIKVVKLFTEQLKLNVHFVDAKEIFLNKLKSISNPEEKRKIIGNTFIEVIENEIKNIGDIDYLIQGTLFPDLIESTSHKGPSNVIKTHHNVGGLPEKMNLKLIEPLRELFKDEVREVGKLLGIPNDFLMRHPFPGPGLAVRILGEITEEKIKILQECDEIFIELLKEKNYYHLAWQAFCVLLPIKTVGVMGDLRTYEYTLVLRAVDSVDGMTAECVEFNFDFLKFVSNKIINEVKGVNRVAYDITSKPPATIEWE